jgi:RNA polymerase sigma-70 factor (ECF subfamily)
MGREAIPSNLGLNIKMTPEFEKRLLNILPHLRAYAKSLTHHSDRADDLVQDAIVRLIKAEDQYDPGTNFKAWATACLRNRFIDLYRHERFVRNAKRGVDEFECAVAPVQDKVVFCDEIAREFESLPLIHREILTLIGINEISYEDAAKILNIPIGTVRSRLARARSVLQNAIEGQKQGREASKPNVMFATMEV